ncbi:hypothetical protein ACFWZ2_34420 [Streptomyces sp. NPDC059002]|uniref:hypothetical protein n=1 Tax=Streptomyces sp. NPDC059002 TaxID=3346690 RepID=UPI0036CEECA5
MEFMLDPPLGIGPLAVGMPREQADAALLALRDPSSVSDSDRPGQHIVRPSGLMISIHCAGGCLEAIELGRPTTATDIVRFRDVDVFGLPATHVARRLGEHTAIHEDPEDPASFIAPDLLLSLWRPFAADDEPDEEQGYFFNSVLVARPGYYDTPEEAAARLQSQS